MVTCGAKETGRKGLIGVNPAPTPEELRQYLWLLEVPPAQFRNELTGQGQ